MVEKIYAVVKDTPHYLDANCNRTHRNEAGAVLFVSEPCMQTQDQLEWYKALRRTPCICNNDRQRMAIAIGRIINLIHSRPTQRYSNAEDEREFEDCMFRCDESLWWAEACIDIGLVTRCREEDNHNEACLKAANTVQQRALAAFQETDE